MKHLRLNSVQDFNNWMSSMEHVDSESVRDFDEWLSKSFYPTFRKDRGKALAEARGKSQTMALEERQLLVTSSKNLAAGARMKGHPLCGLKLSAWLVSILSTVLNLALENGLWTASLLGLVAAVTSVQYLLGARQANAYDQLANVLAGSVKPGPT